jgi:hypothetical protein
LQRHSLVFEWGIFGAARTSFAASLVFFYAFEFTEALTAVVDTQSFAIEVLL